MSEDEYLEDGQLEEGELEDGEFDDEFDDEEDDNLELKAGISGWSISIVAHGIIIFAIAALTVVSQLQKEKPPIRITQIPPPEEQEEPEKPRELEDVKLDIVCDEIVEDPIVTDLDLPVEETETEDLEEAEEPKGREEAVADAECGGVAAFMAIGAGGGAKGAFGSRSGGGRKRGVGRYGGSRASESAVNAALKWFKKHQSPDGRWDVDGYPDNCTDNPKCAPGSGTHSVTNDGGLGDVACTGYAVLCYLGAGFDHKTPSKFKSTVQKGINWLVDAQKKGPNGEINMGTTFNDHRSYSQAVAVMALAEAYGMTMDSRLKGPAQDGVNQLLDWQVADKGDVEGGKLGWGYVGKPGAKGAGGKTLGGSPARNDLSVTGWACMALKSAKAAGLSVGDGMTGSERILKKAYLAANKMTEADLNALSASGDAENPTYPPKVFPYSYNSDTKVPHARTNLACVGALMAIFLGHTADSPMLGSMVSYIMQKDFPQMKAYPLNTYFMYYDTLAIFQAGGKAWDTWNGVVRDVLVGSQKTGKDGACFDGSWDEQGTKFHGWQVGRVVSTAYCCLSLQVYYRYARLKKGKKHR